MAKFRIRFAADGEALERVISAADREEAIERLNSDSGLSGREIEIRDVRKIADLVADAGDEAAAAPKGRNRLAGVVRSGVQRLELATRSSRPVWPPRGKPHEGILPGKWRQEGQKDETGCLPHDCPVRPLGYEGENFYFVDTMGQVFNTGDKAMGVERMQKIFAAQEDFLCWAWPAFTGKGEVSGFKAEEARRDLFAACAKRGPWSSTDMVRGRGAWRDSQGRLVLHCGEHLIIDGKLTDAGEIDGHFYPRRPATASPWPDPVEEAESNPAVDLVKALRSWNWVRGDIDVMLLLGWMGVALMGAALEWRPSVFIVGDAGTGKSEVHKLLKAVLGRALISTTNATEAGLYQIVGHDSLPICIDELEGEDGQLQAQKVIKMARDAASGSVRIRGGADHKGVEFTARSTFLFSAINPPPIPPASLTRLAVLQLRELESHAGAVPTIDAAETIGPRLLKRVVDHWQDFEGILEAYRTVLREEGKHDSRGQQTFGHFLAAAHLLLGDEGMDACGMPRGEATIAAAHYGIMLRADIMPELEGKQPNWLRCIEAIMTAQPDVWRGGDRHSVGQMLEQLERNQMADFNRTADHLAQADVGLLKPGLVGEGLGLAIPNSSKSLGRLLVDTSYGSRTGDGNWSFALKQAPEGIVVQKVVLKAGTKPDNRMSIAGFQRRCMFINLAELKKWQESRDSE